MDGIGFFDTDSADFALDLSDSERLAIDLFDSHGIGCVEFDLRGFTLDSKKALPFFECILDVIWIVLVFLILIQLILHWIYLIQSVWQ